MKHSLIIDLDVRDSMLVNGHSSWAVLLGVGNNGMQAEFRIGELDTCYDCSEHPETSKIE